MVVQGHLVMLDHRGRTMTVDTRRWHGDADEADHSVVARTLGPALDIGCGPGRMLTALGSAGVTAMGIDVSPAAVRLAQQRGEAVVADVFGAVPHPGGWRTALLLDGNIGIGGDPVRLLRRVAELVAPHGDALVEVACGDDGALGGRVDRVRLATRGSAGWFSWAWVPAEALPRAARASGWEVREQWQLDGRAFAHLVRSVRGDRRDRAPVSASRS